MNLKFGRLSLSISCHLALLLCIAAAPAAADVLRMGAIASSRDSATQSFLRFFNTGSSDNTVTVEISDPTSGAVLSSWTSPAVPAGTAAQYPITTIESAAAANYSKPALYAVTVTPRFVGFAQSVLYKPGDGILSNISTCEGGLTTSKTSVPYVHSGLLSAGFPSHLVINNTGSADGTVTLGVYNEASGAKIASYTTQSIVKGGALFLDVADIEAKAKIKPAAGAYHYVIKVETPFTGYVQHLVENVQAGLYTDVTNQCLMTPSAASQATFSLVSSAAGEGNAMPAAFTCDGSGATIPLSWVNPPDGTASLALLMTTLPVDGTTKWNWILYEIPPTVSRLAMSTAGVGKLGAADDGAGNSYAPPCSQGPGAKTYTYTLYALSAAPAFSIPANQITGARMTDAIKPLTLGTAKLNLTYTRATTKPSAATAINCAFIQESTAGYAASVGVDCSASDYAKVTSRGIPAHEMMTGITATNLQVPIPQDFSGANAWRIPLAPAIAAAPTAVVDGPVGVAVNGVPIFNPCKQGGCQNGDTKVQGELDICNGHAGRADDYHYHAAPVCLMANEPSAYWNTHPLGWALDGFAIFGYGDASGATASRDAICGGNTLSAPNAPAGYAYHVTDTSPYVMSCLRGTPSPDLAGQSAKYRPLRQPPVTPFAVSDMTLSTDPKDGFQVLQFTSANAFTTNETGTDSYVNPRGTYRIRYKAVTGADLTALLVLRQNAGKAACWSFEFTSGSGATSQPATTYCR